MPRQEIVMRPEPFGITGVQAFLVLKYYEKTTETTIYGIYLKKMTTIYGIRADFS